MSEIPAWAGVRDVCVFCKRIDNLDYDPTDVPEVVSFEPLNPVVTGHRLFLPIVHAGSAAHSPILAGECMRAAALWGRNVRHSNFNLITSAGQYATQTVMHLHVHYVPRSPDDGLHLPWTGQER